MAGSSRRFTHGVLALVALCAAVVATTTTAAAVPLYRDGIEQPVQRLCLDLGTIGLTNQTMATTQVAVSRDDSVKQPLASLTGGTINTFYVRVRVRAVFTFFCAPLPFVPQFTLPSGMHVDPSAAFPIRCNLNGADLAASTSACPGKANLSTPVAGGPTSYRSSASDFTWAIAAPPPPASPDIWVFEFPVYSNRTFVDRPVVGGLTMSSSVATPSVVQAAVYRPALTCDGRAVTVATQFGEKSTDASDVITGGPGNDRISGGFGNDLVCAGAGNDIVDGGPGNDIINGGTGNDVMSGGTGVDTVDYTANSAVKVNLGLLTAQFTVGAGYDTLGDFENIIGGAGGDTLIGNGVRNVLDGRGGNDNLISGPGNDALLGGAGTDRCDGGSGTDTSSLCETKLGIP